MEYYRKFYLDYPKLIKLKDDIDNVNAVLLNCVKSRNKILVCGNGGSASDSEHIVGELMKGFNLPRPLDESLKEKFQNLPDANILINGLQQAIPAISLVSQTSLITAMLANADLIFAQQVFGYGERMMFNCFINFGNSKNVPCRQTAKALDMKITPSPEKKIQNFQKFPILQLNFLHRLPMKYKNLPYSLSLFMCRT